MDTQTMIERLNGPFSANSIHWRVGPTTHDKTKGIALAYLDSRDIQERLDAAVGPLNWQSRYPWSDGKRVVCEIGVYVPERDSWVWKSDGAGETDHEAEKGSLSSAFKRAAVHFGVGRYLYDLPNIWFPIRQAGKSYKFTDEALQEMTNRLHAWQERYFQKRQAA